MKVKDFVSSSEYHEYKVIEEQIYSVNSLFLKAKDWDIEDTYFSLEEKELLLDAIVALRSKIESERDSLEQKEMVWGEKTATIKGESE